jgi:hypothetical protein
MSWSTSTRSTLLVTAVALIVFVSAAVAAADDEPAAQDSLTTGEHAGSQTSVSANDTLSGGGAVVQGSLVDTLGSGVLEDVPEWTPVPADSLAPGLTPLSGVVTPPTSATSDSLRAVTTTVDSLAASLPDTSAPETRPSWIDAGYVGFRVPLTMSAAFVRPWTAREACPGRGIALAPPAVPAEATHASPMERRVRPDLDAGLVSIEFRSGQHISLLSHVTSVRSFLEHEAWKRIRTTWRVRTLAALGKARDDASGRGLLDIDIPMPLPGPFVRAIGPGANLKVRGSERITFGGQTSYLVDALDQESGPPSRFPQLDMQQNLTVNLEGTIGRKIHVYVDHRSGGDTFGASKANQIRVHYEGDEDEIIQRIELGEVNLSLPGTEFVSYSGQHEGLFGAKMTSKIGKLGVVSVASKEEGKSAGASFTGTSESDSLVIKDIAYKKNTFFVPDSAVLKTNEAFLSLRVYVDDRDGSNDLETGAVPGRAFLNAPSDTVAPAGEYQLGVFDELVELEDYVLVRNQDNIQIGIVEFLRPVASAGVVAVSYETTSGRKVGGTGADGKLRLKMIKKDGGVDVDWEAIRFHELKNVYDLGADQIPEEGFRLTVRKRSSTGEDLDTNADGVPYIQILGLDTHDLSGMAVPDNIVDYEHIDFEKGYLVFPHYTPFYPAFDESTNFYYAAGDTLNYHAFARGLDPKNGLVYSKQTFNPGDDIYYIQVKYDRPRTTFYLGQINIIENSEVVRVNGVRLTRGTDYTIYYPAGQLTLLSEEAKDPDAKVTVDFDYKPFGIGGEKTLLGTRAVYNWSENVRLGSTWMYQSKGTPDDRPRLGEEPSRTVVGDINLDADFAPEFMTRIADAVPLVDTDTPSHLKLSAEAAVSIPEPNTKGFVSVDDMEGTENIGMLGVTRRLWVPASVPIDETGLYAVDAADREYASWYNPDRLVRKGDLFPYLPSQEFDDIQTVLALKDYYADEAWGGGSWAGLMRILSKTGNDYSEYQFFEFWVDAGSDPAGILNVDLGTISEDYYPLRGPDGVLNTEDYDRNGFDADEDTGLDNCCSTGACSSQEPGCVDDTQPSDDYDYDYQGSPEDYRRINGTENNDRLDTEDLNGNYYLDSDERFWRLAIDLEDDTYLVQDNSTYPDPEKRTNWRLYRVPLEDASPIGGITDWTIIKSARVWFEGLDIADEHVLLGSLDIVGNQWEPEPIRDASGTAIPEGELFGESFRVTTKNTKKDADYVPPFDPGVDEDTNLPKREQSLALLFENLAPGHEAAARKLLYSEADYTRYGSLEFYVHGEAGVEEGTSFFLRLGADSLNYYEYGLELREGWLQDPTASRNRLPVPFTALTNLKLGVHEDADTAVVWGDTTRIKGETFKRVGWPSLSRVRLLTIGVRNAKPQGSDGGITGEIWVDDVRLTDVRKEIGWAERATVDAKFADLASVKFDLRRVDGDFHTLKQTQGSGQDNLTYNLNGTLNVDRFVSGLGIATPLTFTWKKSVTNPRFSTGSDVVLSREQSAREKTETLNRSLAASLSRKRQSANFWTHLLVDGLSLRASVSDVKRLSPSKADTSRTIRGRLAYRYSPEKQGIRVFRETRVYLKPTNVRFSVDTHLIHNLNYDVSSDGERSLRTDSNDKKLAGEGHIDFQLLDNLKTSHSVKVGRDLARTFRTWAGLNIGEETERRYENSLTFSPKFGKWFAPQYSFTSSFTDNHGPTVRQPGDPPGIRDLRGRNNHQIRTSFDLKKLIGIGGTARSTSTRADRRDRDEASGEGRGAPDSDAESEAELGETDEAAPEEEGDVESSEPDEEQTMTGIGEPAPSDEGGPGLEVLLDPVLAFLRQMDAIEVSYGTNRSSRFDGITPEDMPGWAYRLGLSTDVAADDRTEEKTLSLGSGVRLAKSIRLKGDYKRTLNSRWYKNALSDSLELTSRTESMNEATKGSMTWSGIEKMGPLSGAFRSVRARSGVEYRRSYSGPYSSPLSKSRTLSLSPVVSFDTTFKNGLSANFSWDKRRTRSFSLTGAGSVTEELTGSTSLSLNYRFSAPQGLKLPFFGQKLRFQSNLDTSLTLRTSSRESRTAATEDGLLLADPTSSVRDFSVTTDATYSFSRNVSGGMQLSFAQSTDAKAERTRRTIGAHLTAEFKF